MFVTYALATGLSLVCMGLFQEVAKHRRWSVMSKWWGSLIVAVLVFVLVPLIASFVSPIVLVATCSCALLALSIHGHEQELPTEANLPEEALPVETVGLIFDERSNQAEAHLLAAAAEDTYDRTHSNDGTSTFSALTGEQVEEFVVETTETLAEEPVEELVEESMETLAEEPVEEFVEETTETLAEEPVEDLVEETTETMAEEPVEEFVEETTETLAEEPVEDLVEETTETLAEQPVEEFAEETTETLAEEPVEDLVEETTDTLAEEPVEEFVEETAETLAEEPVEGLIDETNATLSEESMEDEGSFAREVSQEWLNEQIAVGYVAKGNGDYAGAFEAFQRALLCCREAGLSDMLKEEITDCYESLRVQSESQTPEASELRQGA